MAVLCEDDDSESESESEPKSESESESDNGSIKENADYVYYANGICCAQLGQFGILRNWRETNMEGNDN